MPRRILLPLPDRDFDVTEVAVPWHVLTRAGHEVVFATESGGQTPAADPRLLTGVLFGKLGAADDAKACYGRMIGAGAYRAPISWRGADPAAFDALLLPGGHAPGMRQYLGSEELRDTIRAFFRLAPERPVAAICHGVLPLARAGVISRVRTTCLPRYMEALAHGLTFWKLGRYYRTYPAYVEDEVKQSLEDPAMQFVRGPVQLGKRGTEHDDAPAFVVEDGRYVSARWPGDAWLFARRLLERLA
jgi:putative intracellular protease/amidase